MAQVTKISDFATPVETEEKEFQNTSKGGAPVKYRISSAAAAHAIYNDLLEDYYPVAEARAKIQGMYDGNPPYDSDELRRLGQAHRCNVNFREMESIVDMNTGAAWALHSDVPALIELKPSPKTRKMMDAANLDWGSIIAEEYTTTLKEWDGFLINLNLNLHEYFKNGLGCSVWPDEWDWRSRAVKAGNVLVPPLTRVDPSRQQLVFVRDEMELGDLYRAIEDRKAAQAAGWNVGAVKSALVKFYRRGESATDDQTQTTVWESLQNMIRVGDPATEKREFCGLPVVHILCREVSGDKRVSHMIICDNSLLDDQFLFEKRGRFSCMREAVWFLPYSFADGYLRSSKGLGHRSYFHCEFSNRFLGRIFDGGMLSATLLLQGRANVETTRLGLLRLGGDATLIPQGVTVLQNTFSPQITQLISLRGLSKDILHNNTGVYRPYSELLSGGERDAPKTARQVMTEEAREAKFERNQVEHFYNCWQAWHRETYRRLTAKDYVKGKLDRPGQDAAKEFVARCVERGVPESVIFDSKAFRLAVSRAIGLGSPSVKLDLTNQLVAMKGSMDERGRRTSDREWAAARFGYENVDKFFPVSTRDNLPSNATSIAVLENNDFMEGRDVPAGSDQPHMIHLAVVMSLLEQISQAYLQGSQDPVSVVQIMTPAINHAAAHVQFMQQDPTRKEQVGRAVEMIKEYAEVFADAQQKAKQLIQQRQQELQQAEQDQQRQAMSPEALVKLEEIRGKLALEQSKQESLNAMRAQKTAEQLAIRRDQAALDQLLKTQVTAADIERKAKETDAKIEIDRRRA